METFKLNPEDFDKFVELTETPLPDVSKLEKLSKDEADGHEL